MMIAFERCPERAVTLIQRLRKLVALSRSKSAETEDSTADQLWFNTLTAESVTEHDVWHFRAGGVLVEVHVGDFLLVNPSVPPFSSVNVVIADPSCSGTGLPEHNLSRESGPSSSRLRRLAAFQKRIISHALEFPLARTVIYSTCSVLESENEAVIAHALTCSKQFQVVEALPWWTNNRAQEQNLVNRYDAWVGKCVHCDPATHLCRGFFLCRLDRRISNQNIRRKKHVRLLLLKPSARIMHRKATKRHCMFSTQTRPIR